VSILNSANRTYLLPVFIAYFVLLLGLAGVAEFIQLANPASSTYALQPTNPPSIFLAPIANNWPDYIGTLFHISAYLVLFAFLFLFNPALANRSYFRTFFVLTPVFGGLLGSLLFYLQLYRLGQPSGGAGSSIISAAMTGQLLVLSAVVLYDLSRRKEILPTIVPILSGLALVYVFFGDFVETGNILAHTLGLFSGVLISYAYLRLTGLGSSSPEEAQGGWSWGIESKTS